MGTRCSRAVPTSFRPTFSPFVRATASRRPSSRPFAANMNMLANVWGGAVYGEDAFYDRCDELGLLVWQDFMFACCMVPGDSPAMRLRWKPRPVTTSDACAHHPSLAIWCGNNESEKAWETWGWPKSSLDFPSRDSLAVQRAYDSRIRCSSLPHIVAEEESGPILLGLLPHA